MDYSTLPLFSLQSETKEIPLTQGKVAIVDAADYDYLIQFKWCAGVRNGKIWYAMRSVKLASGKWTGVYMHREILGAKPGVYVDHIDGNGLMNVRSNLRIATASQNMRNRKIHHNNNSGFKGVRWNKDKKRWTAQIAADRRIKYLGYFDDPEEAARAYDSAASELHGEFARLNFDD